MNKILSPVKLFLIALSIAGCAAEAVRTQTGCSIKIGTYQGRESITLENSLIRVSIVPSYGGRVIEYTLKSSNHNQTYFRTYDDQFSGLNTWVKVGEKVEPEHDLLSQKLGIKDSENSYRIVKKDKDEAEITLTVKKNNWVLEKSISIFANSPSLDYKAKITNNSEEEKGAQLQLHFMWQAGGSPDLSDVLVIPTRRGLLRHYYDLSSYSKSFELADNWAAVCDLSMKESVFLKGDHNLLRYYIWSSKNRYNLEAFSKRKKLGKQESLSIEVKCNILEGIAAITHVEDNIIIGVIPYSQQFKQSDPMKVAISLGKFPFAPLRLKGKFEQALTRPYHTYITKGGSVGEKLAVTRTLHYDIQHLSDGMYHLHTEISWNDQVREFDEEIELVEEKVADIGREIKHLANQLRQEVEVVTKKQREVQSRITSRNGHRVLSSQLDLKSIGVNQKVANQLMKESELKRLSNITVHQELELLTKLREKLAEALGLFSDYKMELSYFLANGKLPKDVLIPPRHIIYGVPHIVQKPMYCMYASTAMVFSYWGRKTTQDEIAEKLATHLPPKVAAFPTSQGFEVSLNKNWLRIRELKRWISREFPVIVMANSAKGGTILHYRTAIGYDDEREEIIIEDTGSPDMLTIYSYDELINLWDDEKICCGEKYWFLVIYPRDHEEKLANIHVTDTLKKSLQVKLQNGYGVRYCKHQEYGKAMDVFAKILDLEKDNLYAILGLASCYYAKANYDKAISLGEKALKINPSDDRAHLALGHFYSKAGMYDKAICSAKEFIHLKPERECAYYELLGVIEIRKGNVDKGKAYFRTVKEKCPFFKWAMQEFHYEMGQHYKRKGVLEKARDELEKVTQINPDDEYWIKKTSDALQQLAVTDGKNRK